MRVLHSLPPLPWHIGAHAYKSNYRYEVSVQNGSTYLSHLGPFGMLTHLVLLFTQYKQAFPYEAYTWACSAGRSTECVSIWLSFVDTPANYKLIIL